MLDRCFAWPKPKQVELAMKNLLSKLVMIALAASMIFVSHAEVTIFGKKFIGPMRATKCVFAPEKYNCSSGEKKEAKRWLIGASIAVVMAAATAIGIALTASSINNKKVEAERMELDDLIRGMVIMPVPGSQEFQDIKKRYDYLASKIGNDVLDAQLIRVVRYEDLKKINPYTSQIDPRAEQFQICIQNQPKEVINLARHIKFMQEDSPFLPQYKARYDAIVESGIMEDRELYLTLQNKCNVPKAIVDSVKNYGKKLEGSPGQ